MREPVLTVSWNNHATELTTVCKTLLENNYFVDCTIAAEGKSLKAHRLILSACSPYFHMRFSAECDKHPIVILKNTLFDTLKMMMDFVYNGKVDIPANQFEPFLELAVSLQINGLKDSLRKDRGTDIGSSAEGNTSHWASRPLQRVCEFGSSRTNCEGTLSNSSQQYNFGLAQGCTDTPRESSALFIESRNSCEMVQSGAISLRDRQSCFVYNDIKMSVNTETRVKYVPLDSEIQILEPESKKPDYGKQHNFTHGNFMTAISDETRPSFRQNLDQYAQRESSVPLMKSSDSHKVVPSGAETIHLQGHLSRTVCDTEMSANTETSVQYSAFDSDIGILETKTELSDDDDDKQEESTSANFQTKMTESSASFGSKVDENSCAEGPSPAQDEQQATQQRRRRPRRAKDHVRLTRDASLQCSECGASFTSPQGLEDHRRQHSGEEPPLSDPAAHEPQRTAKRPHSSNVRKKGLHSSRALAVHKHTDKGEKPYLCDVCGKAFSRSGHLTAHERIHTGEKPYPCDVCGKAFSDSSALACHKRIHTGEKPYPCDVCGKAFTFSSNLAVHKRLHTGDKPYPCDVCGKAFSQSSTLACHKRLHTGEKPYPCDVCEKAFNDPWVLARHKRIHTQGRFFDCDACSLRLFRRTDFIAHWRSCPKKQ